MGDNQSPDNSSNSPENESPPSPSTPSESPPSSSSPPPSSPPPSSSSSPPPSPPPSSPPPSSPPSSSSSSPPPSSQSPPPSSKSSPPPSPQSPPPSSKSSPPPSSESPPPLSSSPPPSSPSQPSPPPSSPPPSQSNSNTPPSQNNQSPPPASSNNNTSPPNNNNNNNSGGAGGNNNNNGGNGNNNNNGGNGNNNNNGGNGNNNNNGGNGNNDNNGGNSSSSSSNNNVNNGGQQWQPPPPPHQSSNTPSNNNGSGGEGGGAALTPPSGRTKAPTDSSPSGNGSMVSIPLVAAVVAGAALLIIIMLLLFFAMRRKKNKQDYGGRSSYYSHGNTGITSTPQPNNWHTAEAHHMGGETYYNNGAYHQHYNANDQLSDRPPLTPSHNGVVTNSDMSSGPHGPALPPPPPPPVALGFGQSSFTYDELAAATGGFAQANLLGQGGFGYVHKGILPNGKEIAVKSLKSGSGQGEREFKAEVEIISRVHHRHLVSLVGYCIAGGQRMLVYEFLPNNNLEFHLHGKGQPVMDWPTRLKIALGSAKGLAYLHEDCHPRIIHRDIKSSNILLDFTFEAKVSDFGLAKLTTDNNTHVSTRVMGTFGYLAPEYASSGKLTEKSDVFSFGVMLLELITGRRPVDPSGAMEDSLVDWARPLCLRSLEDGNFSELADPYLEKNYPAEEMARMIACAAASIRHSSRRRPKMSHIVRALEGDVSLEDLKDGIKPGQASIFVGGTGLSVAGSSTTSRSSDFDNSLYTEDIKKLRKMAIDNTSGGPYISSEYGATSEYGLNPSSSSSELGGSRGHSPQVQSSFRIQD